MSAAAWKVVTWLQAQKLLAWASPLLPPFSRVLFREEDTGLPHGSRCFLTVDDAPGRDLQDMHRLLDVLKENDAKATFFVIADYARTDGARGWLKRAVAEGHELANHLVRDEPGPSDAAEFERLLDECESVIEEVVPGYGDRDVKFFRAPHGRMRGCMAEVLRRRRYVSVLCDVYAHDPQLGPADPEFVARHLAQTARAGSILVCHSPDPLCSPPRAFVPIYESLLPALKRRGFELPTLADVSLPPRVQF
eukprot:TRINITY_DN9621_c3_g1_i1.p1 TRINITY_DN9621_c3_g1~~TRINITY_DN9621_c3_g1_i1.p1  ORF type:complete len:279 (+),score=90.55 TRINITY_DN9621_c3_g1_i1:90-839(+)